MAGELNHNHTTSGLSSVYAVLSNAAGLVNASGSATQLSATTANWPTAAITLSDAAMTYRYKGSIPTSTPSGKYLVDVRFLAGSTAATSDTCLGTGYVEWDGTAEIVGANITHGNFTAVEPESGSGASECTLNFNDSGVGIADADAWITSDEAGSAVVAGTRQTDSAGDVTFLLDAGTTYYFWAQKDGYDPVEGESFVAVAD